VARNSASRVPGEPSGESSRGPVRTRAPASLAVFTALILPQFVALSQTLRLCYHCCERSRMNGYRPAGPRLWSAKEQI